MIPDLYAPRGVEIVHLDPLELEGAKLPLNKVAV